MKANTALAAWVHDLNDDYLADWANRGLLRRGRKLAEPLASSLCNIDETGCKADIDGHQQTLDAPGFEHLYCSCPAAGACHHMIAFLLCLQQHEALQTETAEPDADAVVPWLSEDFKALVRQLGHAHVKRAQQLLLQGTEVELDDSSGGLIAIVTDRSRYTVRIPRSTGLAAAICTCNATRCVHQALVILYARQRAQLNGPLPASAEALTETQRGTLVQIQTWLGELLALGTTGLAYSLSERGQALATVARQADLPLLGSQISTLCQLQEDELAGRTFIQIAQFRTQLAQLWLRLRALQATPLLRPLPQFAGVHKRDYRAVQNLRLIGIGAEQWRSKTGYLGLSLHLYAPEQNAWYRHVQARGVSQAESSGWSPAICWKRERWADAIPYRDIPGCGLRLLTGWGTAEGQLSGRPGTYLESLPNAAREADALPIERDFVKLAEDYAQVLSADPAAPPPRLPALIEVAVADAPAFRDSDQLWTQWVYDDDGHALELIVSVTDDISAQALAALNRWWKKDQRWHLVFGYLSLRQQYLSLYPISLCCHGETKWRHPTLT